MLTVAQSPPEGTDRLTSGRSAETASRPECGNTALWMADQRQRPMSLLPNRRLRSATPSCSARVTASSQVSTDGVVWLSHQGEVFDASVWIRKRVTKEKRP